MKYLRKRGIGPIDAVKYTGDNAAEITTLLMTKVEDDGNTLTFNVNAETKGITVTTDNSDIELVINPTDYVMTHPAWTWWYIVGAEEFEFFYVPSTKDTPTE